MASFGRRMQIEVSILRMFRSTALPLSMALSDLVLLPGQALKNLSKPVRSSHRFWIGVPVIAHRKCPGKAQMALVRRVLLDRISWARRSCWLDTGITEAFTYLRPTQCDANFANREAWALSRDLAILKPQYHKLLR